MPSSFLLSSWILSTQFLVCSCSALANLRIGSIKPLVGNMKKPAVSRSSKAAEERRLDKKEHVRRANDEPSLASKNGWHINLDKSWAKFPRLLKKRSAIAAIKCRLIVDIRKDNKHLQINISTFTDRNDHGDIFELFYTDCGNCCHGTYTNIPECTALLFDLDHLLFCNSLAIVAIT